jgi:SAM-dependent methyltransferase
MHINHEQEWEAVWSRKNFFSWLIHSGRRIYNLFFVRSIRKYLTPETAMLEIGCGTSALSLLVAPDIKRLVGVDISETALNFSKKTAAERNIKNASFEKGDCRNIRFTDEFDFVWSHGLIEHFDNPGDVAREHYKATRPGGTVLISVPYLYSYHYLWYLATRPKFLRRFWPWTDQEFFTHRTLQKIGKNITDHSRVFMFRPALLGIIFLEMKK